MAADISKPPLNWLGSAVEEYMTELVAPDTKRFLSTPTDSFWSVKLDQDDEDDGKSAAKAMHLVGGGGRQGLRKLLMAEDELKIYRRD